MGTTKTKLSELAKDLGQGNKVLTDILTQYAEAPKSTSKTLDDNEMNLVFEVLTQKHQVADFNARPAKNAPAAKEAAAPKAAPAAQAAPAAKEAPAPKEAPSAKETPAQKSGGQQGQGRQNNNNGQQNRNGQNNNGQQGQGRQNNNGQQNRNGQNNNGQQGQGRQNNNGQQNQNRQNNNGQQGQGRQNNNNSQQNRNGQNNNGQQGQGRQNNNGQQNRNSQNNNSQQNQNRQNNNGQQGQNRQNGQQAAKPQQGQQQAAAKPAQPSTTQRRQQRVVDTRGTTETNLSKYDERFDNMAGNKADKVGGNRRQGREKIGGNKQRSRQQGQQQGNKRRQEERDKMQRLQLEIAKQAKLHVQIPDEISVQELASRMKKTGTEVVKKLFLMGVMASLSDTIDYETAYLVAEEFGCIPEHEVIVTVEERLIDTHEDTEEELQDRAPVVVVMGHVDHGKTSLLDYIRKTSVAAGEAGGITQAIGAYVVDVNGKPITFLDTPGHEAFTSMRARGAMVTDVAILVVAATEGIKPQTVESINHAKAAGIPIVVAINKMDMPGANAENVKQQLTKYDLVPEEWGGDVICCPISAKTGQGVDDLLEMLVLQAEMQGLRANPNRAATGAVIEARLDKGRGPIMTVLVQNGTLHQGDVIIAGTSVGRVRTMVNDKGQRVKEAGPSVPVEIAGMSEVPNAGDVFNAVDDERMARELVEERKTKARLEAAGGGKKVSLEDLFARIQEGEMKDFNIVVKADVQGSAEAVKASLEKLSNEEVRVRVIHSGVGAINESDVMLASTSNAIIVGFNVRPDNNARDNAARNEVELRMYRVIYDCINDVEAAMKGLLAPKFEEKIIGHAEVRQTYKVSKVGTVCGCYVLDGEIQRGCSVRVLRDNVVLFEGELASLRRFKDDVKRVASGYECGMQVEKFNDIKELDVIECFVMEQINA